MTTFGKHITLDFRIYGDYIHAINDHGFLLEWLDNLVRFLDMKIHQIDDKKAILIDTWEPEGIPEAAGTSINILITTSSISVHTCIDPRDPKFGLIYLDLFSCKDYAASDVHCNVNNWWGYPQITKSFIQYR